MATTSASKLQAQAPTFNAKTGLPNPVITEADFAAFARWLSDSAPAATAERDRRFAAFGEKGGLAPQQAREGFVEHVIGVFLRGQIETGVLGADPALLNHADTRERLQAVHRSLSRLFDAVPRTSFESQLQAAGVNPVAIRALGALCSQDRDQLHEAVSRVAQIARGMLAEGPEATDARDAFAAWLAQPETRMGLEAPRRAIDPLDDPQLQAMGRFAPLVLILSEHIAPRLRAARLGWLLAYVQSGLLIEDFSQPATGGGADEAKARAHWIELATQADQQAGQQDNAADARKLALSLERRLSFVACAATLTGRGNEAQARIARAPEPAFAEGVFHSIAGPDSIDVALRSPGLGYTVVFCSPEPSLAFKRDQIARQICSLLDALNDQPKTKAQAKGREVEEGPEVEGLRGIHVLVPAALESRAATTDRPTNGQDFFGLFDQGDPLREGLCDALNPLGALASVIKTGFPVDQIERVHVHLAGRKEHRWGAARAAIQNAALARRNDAAAKELCLMAEHAWAVLNDAAFKADVVLNGAASETNITPEAAIPLLNALDFSVGCAKTVIAMERAGLLSTKAAFGAKKSLAASLLEIRSLKDLLVDNADKEPGRDYDGELNDALNRAREFIEKAIR